MNDTLYTFKDINFDDRRVESYTLLLLICNSYFSFAVIHEHKLMAWGRQCPLAELTNPHELEELLTSDFESIITAVQPTGFTLVPESLYIADRVADIAKYLDVQPKDTVFAQQLDADNRIIFKVSEGTSMAAADYNWPKVAFSASGLINALASDEPQDDKLYVHVNPLTIDVIYFESGKLKLYNTFNYTSEDELAYFTLFAVEQLELDRQLTTVILSGDIVKNSAYSNRLADFFQAVEFNNLQLLDLPHEVEPHQILALSALTLCASLADA